MASKRSVRRAQVHVPYTCALCDNIEDVRWFCNDCQENLCEKCKNVHQRGKKTRNDRIVPIKEASKGDAKTTEVCKIHPGKSCDLYCSTCNVVMCSMCFTQKHNTHAFKHVEEVSDPQNPMRDDEGPRKSNTDQPINQQVVQLKTSEQLKTGVNLMVDAVVGQFSSLL